MKNFIFNILLKVYQLFSFRKQLPAPSVKQSLEKLNANSLLKDMVKGCLDHKMELSPEIMDPKTAELFEECVKNTIPTLYRKAFLEKSYTITFGAYDIHKDDNISYNADKELWLKLKTFIVKSFTELGIEVKADGRYLTVSVSDIEKLMDVYLELKSKDTETQSVGIYR